MVSSVSEQDELSPVLRLATREGKMALSCPLGITRCVPQENTKFVQSRWLNIGLVPFLCLWTSTPSRSINTQKNRSWPICSHVDRTSLVNNPYIVHIFRVINEWFAVQHGEKKPMSRLAICFPVDLTDGCLDGKSEKRRINDRINIFVNHESE